jgi:hypothetical protein
MPNWCENRLTIKGPNVKQVLDAIKGTDADGTPLLFDFEQVVPMPEALREVDAGTRSEIALLCASGEELGSKWRQYAWTGGATTVEQLCQYCGWDFEEMVRLGHQLLDNQRRFGAKDWYEWACEKWGTKWNATDVSLDEEGDEVAVLMFRTAWSPPFPIIEALSVRFPEHTFSLDYSEFMVGFRGYIEGRGGEVLGAFHDDERGARVMSESE